MKISRLNPFDGTSKTAAFFDIETEEGINIKGCTLVEGTNGLFVGVPSAKGKDKIEMPETIIKAYPRLKEIFAN
jgi:DNA-binding cell septation regulator SpoVG